MNDSVGLYLNQIGAEPLLTAEEERMLAQTIEAGRAAAERLEAPAGEAGPLTPTMRRNLKRDVQTAAAAKDRFIRANLRLVVSIARRYPLPSGMDLLDLVQEGNLGLEPALGLPAGLDHARQLLLLIGREERHLADLVQVQTNRIIHDRT